VERQALYNSVAPLRNVGALAALIDRVKGRTNSLPGMGTYYGPSGFGKTMAAVYCTNRFQAITVQVKSAWSKKTLCEAILAEIGLPAGPTIARMLDQISDHLAITDAPLLIDEADFLVQRNMIEIVRDIYEGSGAPVILIGEELLPQKLRAWERVHGRILDWVAAQPGAMTDVAHLAKVYAPGIAIAADLQAKLLAASRGSIRRICVNLDRLREFAATRGLTAVNAADWGSQQFFTGTAPEVRRFEGEAAARVGARVGGRTRA
jgi:DNA transposition AAA+ family ATPase